MDTPKRVRLGAYFLFALLLLSIPVSLLVTHFEAKRLTPHWRLTPQGYVFDDTGQREQAVKFVMQRYGLSRRGAERYIHQQEKKTGLRVGSGHVVPFGALVDYYTVDGTKVPHTAKYEGTAAVVHPASAAARAYLDYVRREAKRENHPEWLDAVAAMLKKNFLLIPCAWGMNPVNGVAHDLAQATLQANTTNYRIAVICTILPGFRDISPRSDGDTDPNDTGTVYVGYASGNTPGAPGPTPAEVCYRQVPPPPIVSRAQVGLVYNFADTQCSPRGTDEPFAIMPGDFGSYFDSPGGAFNAGGNWGIPYGIPSGQAWDYTQEAVAPHASHATNALLQDAMYDLFFDEAFTAPSVSNWFYQQTRGAVKITGTTNDIIGWLRSAHQTNRYQYQIGGGNAEFVFPGTPLIRTGRNGTPPPVEDAAYDPAVSNVIRATLSDRGCTILFSRPNYMFTDGGSVSQLAGRVTIRAYTSADTDATASGTQPGTVTIDWNESSGIVRMDPYDARRWTITNPGGNSWKFFPAGSTTSSAFVPVDNGSWSLDVVGWPLLGGSMSRVARNQRRGCPDLANTLVTAADMRICLFDRGALDTSAGWPAWDATSDTSTTFGNRPFARLKSLWYYTHSYSGAVTIQIEHLNNEWGYGDDISGTTIRPGAAKPRVKPFDTGPNDPWNGGHWSTGATVREGSSGEYAGDVNNVLRDNGISLSGYNYLVYIAADGGAPTPGGGDNMTVSGFQPSSSLTNINESGAGVVFHELCHAILGAVDLYDNDLYANHSLPPPNPPYHECAAMGPYSIMDSGGRLDAWHLEGLLPGWGL